MIFLNPRTLVAALLFISVCAPVGALGTGQPAPEIDLPGSSLVSKLSQLKGKVVYVDFWASWCSPCKQSFPWMNDMHQKYSSQGLQIIGINVDAQREDADKFLRELPAQFAVAFDSQGESAKRFAVKAMPTAFLIDKAGSVLHVHQGFRAQDRAGLEALFRDALKAN